MQLAENLGNQKRTSIRVSVVLPAYNEEKEILSALHEMEKQTYENLEIIVVDDGSTDATLKIATEYAKTNQRVRVLHNKRGGPALARNLGIKESTGEVVFFGECDCLYDADYLEKAIDCLNQRPNSVAVCLTGAPFVTRATLATDCLELENVVQHKLLTSGKIKPFYAWVYTKDILEKVGGFDPNLFQAEDKDLFQRITSRGYEIGWVPGIHWRHRRNESTLQLARGWIKRGRTRVLYSLKHHSTRDLAKTLLPIWLLLFGIVISFLSFYAIGAIAITVSLGTLVGGSLRMLWRGRTYIRRKTVFFFYPIFCITRNYAFGIGYSISLFKIGVLKLQHKPLTWNNM